MLCYFYKILQIYTRRKQQQLPIMRIVLVVCLMFVLTSTQIQKTQIIPMHKNLQQNHNKIKKSSSDFMSYFVSFAQETRQFNKVTFQESQVILFIKICVGSPCQDLFALLDTGSGAMFVTSPYCQSCKLKSDRYQKGLVTYNYTQSATFKNTNKNKTLAYSSTQVRGFIGKDVIQFNNLSVLAQFVVVENQMSAAGFATVSTLIGLNIYKKQQNILDIGYKQGKIISPNYAFQISNDYLKQKSYFYYNISDSDFSQAKYVRTFRTHSWSVALQQFSVNGVKYDMIDEGIIDTGTSLITIPSAVYKKIYYRNLQQNCNYKTNQILLCQCTDLQKYPNLYIKINEQISIELRPEHYLYGWILQLGYCKLLLYPTDNVLILGQPFLQNFITIFNKQNNTIGFIKKQIIIHKYIKNMTILKIFQALTYIMAVILILKVIIMLKNKIKIGIRQRLLRTHIQNHNQQPKQQNVQSSMNKYEQQILEQIKNKNKQVQLQNIN